MNQRYGLTTAWALGLVLLNGAVWAVDDVKTPEVNPEATMQQMIKLGSPNDHHKVLEPTVGKWNVVVKGWMKAGDTPQVSSGTAENTWILGGRFVKQDFKGSWAGQPFEGMGLTGYDNNREEYQSIWMDNMSTGLMQSAGFYNTKTKTLSTTGQFSCPMTGEKARWIRSDLKIKSNDAHVYTSYFKSPDGKEFKSMEITYTRAK